MKDRVCIDINGRAYTLHLFNVLDGYDFVNSTESNESLCWQALQRCLAPDGGDLSNPTVFDEWFSVHPRDMGKLQHKAVHALREPFGRELSRYYKERDKLFQEQHNRFSLNVPEKWGKAAFFGRITAAGLCSYAELAGRSGHRRRGGDASYS